MTAKDLVRALLWEVDEKLEVVAAPRDVDGYYTVEGVQIGDPTDPKVYLVLGAPETKTRVAHRRSEMGTGKNPGQHKGGSGEHMEKLKPGYPKKVEGTSGSVPAPMYPRKHV